jgi:hypothetical protein
VQKCSLLFHQTQKHGRRKVCDRKRHATQGGTEHVTDTVLSTLSSPTRLAGSGHGEASTVSTEAISTPLLQPSQLMLPSPHTNSPETSHMTQHQQRESYTTGYPAYWNQQQPVYANPSLPLPPSVSAPSPDQNQQSMQQPLPSPSPYPSPSPGPSAPSQFNRHW